MCSLIYSTICVRHADMSSDISRFFPSIFKYDLYSPKILEKRLHKLAKWWTIEYDTMAMVLYPTKSCFLQ